MKKIISILLVFLLSIGVCCNFKVFAQEIDVSMPKEEYNKKIIEELGLTENSSTEKNPQELKIFLLKLCATNMEKKGWFSVNGYSDLMSLNIYGEYNDVTIKQNPTKKYNVSYSTKDDGYIRAFTINELKYEYSGVMPTDNTFGIPFYTNKEWNSDIQKDIPQSPSEVSGKVVKRLVDNISFMNLLLTEKHPTWGLTINGKMSQEDLDNITSYKFTIDMSHIK